MKTDKLERWCEICDELMVPPDAHPGNILAALERRGDENLTAEVMSGWGHLLTPEAVRQHEEWGRRWAKALGEHRGSKR